MVKHSNQNQLFTPYQSFVRGSYEREAFQLRGQYSAYPFINDQRWEAPFPDLMKSIGIEAGRCKETPFIAHTGSVGPVLSALPELVDRGVKHIWLVDRDPLIPQINERILNSMFRFDGLSVEDHKKALVQIGERLMTDYNTMSDVSCAQLMEEEIKSLGKYHYLMRRQEVRKALSKCRILTTPTSIGSSRYLELAANFEKRKMRAVWVSVTNVGNWASLGASDAERDQFETGLKAIPNSGNAVFTYSSWGEKAGFPTVRPPVIGADQYLAALRKGISDFARNQF